MRVPFSRGAQTRDWCSSTEQLGPADPPLATIAPARDGGGEDGGGGSGGGRAASGAAAGSGPGAEGGAKRPHPRCEGDDDGGGGGSALLKRGRGGAKVR